MKKTVTALIGGHSEETITPGKTQTISTVETETKHEADDTAAVTPATRDTIEQERQDQLSKREQEDRGFFSWFG